jgi:cytidyltransferase-like protein
MRIFADGVFDFYHKGHREHFERLKHIEDGVELIVGIISDKECASYKRVPKMNEEQRLTLVSKDKHVDTAMITPLIITKEFLKANNIDFVYHAFATPEDEAKQGECFAVPRALGMFRTIPYVKGISSTEILSEWEHIWQKKGTIDSNDLQLLNGYEETTFDPASAWSRMKDTLNICETDEILEVGCGAGYIAQHIEHFYVGLDASQPLVLKHHQILNNVVFQAYAHNIPFADNSFDIVIMNNVCGYFKDIDYTKSVIRELERVASKAVFIGDARHKPQPKRSKHIYKGPTQHLINTPEDFEGYTITPGFYDPDYYFCAHKLKNK